MAATTTHRYLFRRGYLWLLDNAEAELAAFGGGDFNQGLKYADQIGWSFCVKLQDGQSEVNAGIPQLIKSRRAAFGLADRPILGWSSNRDQPEADAQKTNGLIYREKVDGWCSECEFAYKGTPNSVAYGRLKRFIDEALTIENGASAIKAFMQEKDAWAFVYLPNEPAGNFMDWAQLKRTDGRYSPECYPNEFPGAPSQWPKDALTLAVVSDYTKAPRSYVHPLIGMYPSRQNVPLQQYVDNLKQSKQQGGFTAGFSVYGTQHLTIQDRALLRTITHPEGTAGSYVLATY